MADMLEPNAEDENGSFFDPWDALGLYCLSYNSEIDQRAIAVLRGIGEKLYCSEIAQRASMAEDHVELFQSIFCSANWCEYGTSPRGCWFVHNQGPDFGARMIAAWETYFARMWPKEALS